MQLDFFWDAKTVEMKCEIRSLKDSNERVRKKLFAENGKLKKEVSSLQERLDVLERNICRGIVV